ncbi:MAG: Gfo/Idh/MocA family oxidoreductase [Clostridiales bacterium]|nr:Gfo/Idh/MocA family oxidoreductase [Clostridiales bacterium]
MKKVRLGIIGFGNMGTGHAKNWLDGKMPEFELTAVADRKESRLEAAKELLKDSMQYFAEGSDLIRSDACDAVLIVVPHYQHPELAIEAMAHHKHVMCEKPAGVYTKQVREMNEAAAKSDVVFAMMFNQRTNNLYKKMHEIVSSGELGALKRVNWIVTDWYRTQSYYDSGAWRATWEGEGGGVLLNQCPHNLDLLQWICGMPVRVRAFCHEGKWHDIEVEDDVTAYMEFENGATGVFITSTGDSPGTNRFEVLGEMGKLVCDGKGLTFYKLDVNEREFNKKEKQGFASPKHTVIDIESDGMTEQHSAVMNAFAAAILRGEPLVAGGEEGINGLMLSNAMHLSSWKGEMVSLPVDEDEYLNALNEKRKTSSAKAERNVVFSTEGSW